MSPDRPRLVVAFGPGSRPRQWSDGARAILDRFAAWRPLDVGVGLDEVDAALAEADGLLICGWGDLGLGYLSRRRLEAAPRLRFIGSTSHYRQAEFLDLEAAADRGIGICDTAPVNARWVAEYELALCLAALRRIPQEHETVGAGGWIDYSELPEESDLLTGRRVGLVSFGAIHRRLARLLEPFETVWEVFDPYVAAAVVEAAGGRSAGDLLALASRSEMLFVATPPTPETIGLIGRDVIGALPSGALVVVISRMSVVDQVTLVERLEAGEIVAATDVYDPEPPAADSPLRRLPNVVHTPHRAGGTLAAQRAVFREQCEEARRFFQGAPLRYPLRPELVALIPRTGAPPLDPPPLRRQP